MDRLDPDQALLLLRGFEADPSGALASREALIAYTLIHTLCHYWPSRTTAEYSRVLLEFEFFKSKESSRFIKQRRILLRQLLRAFEVR